VHKAEEERRRTMKRYWISAAVMKAFKAAIDSGELRLEDIDNLVLMWRLGDERQGRSLYSFSLEDLAKRGRSWRPGSPEQNEPDRLLESITRLLAVSLKSLPLAIPGKRGCRFAVHPLEGFMREDGTGELAISSFINFPSFEKESWYWGLTTKIF
jgi:hypothetical protein